MFELLGRLREDRAATDPILIIAGIAITLILLVGGSFAVSGFMNNARNLNVQSDLDRIAVAMQASEAVADFKDAPTGVLYASGPRMDELLGGTGVYEEWVLPDGMPTIDVVASEGAEIYVTWMNQDTSDTSSPVTWMAFAKSVTGDWFFRTGLSSTTWNFGQVRDGAVVAPDGFDEEWNEGGYNLDVPLNIVSLDGML